MTSLSSSAALSRHRSRVFHALLVGPVLLLVIAVSRGEPARPARPSPLDAAIPAAEGAWTTAAYSRVFFAAPSGRAGSSGSAAQPLDLASALSGKGPLRPGDLLWLRGGTYVGNYRSDLSGTADAFIVVAQFPGERAVLDGVGEPGREVLRVDGAYTVYWGFEVTNSSPSQAGHSRGTGIDVFGPYTKFINLVIHHTGNGMGVWTPALEAEVYGNLIYEVGWDAEDRGHGHSIYVQNDARTKRFIDNILFDGSSFGIHAYTQGGQINNLHFEGNIAFDHGSRSAISGPKANFLVGGRQVAEHPVLLSNYGYYPWTSVGRNADIGYINGCADAVIRDNYLAGGMSVVLTRCSDTTMTNNEFLGRVDEATSSHFPGNQYLAERPTAGRVFVRANRYVRGRGHVAIFNWDRRSSVRVDLSGLGLRLGEAFEIRDVRNFFGAPLLAATYREPSVDLPLDRLRRAPTADPEAPGPPEFGAAVVLPRGRDAAYGPPWHPSGQAEAWWHDAIKLSGAEGAATKGPRAP